MFPSPDFLKFIGRNFVKDFLPFVAQSLLLLSFLVATFLPFLIFKVKVLIILDCINQINDYISL